MIDGDKALEYLKNKLINLINKGEINATYDQSNTTVSFYISDIVATNRPLLSLRLSNHHENFNNRERQRGELPQGDSNISIELYKPSEDKKNRVRKKVTHFYSVEKPQVIPFSVTTIEYIPEKMQEQDVTLIYQSILNWIRSRNKGATYIDPLQGTSRQASMKTHQANIKLRREVTRAEMNFYKRYGMGDSIEPRYNIIKENNQINCNKNMNRNRKNVVRLTESKLREMIKESVRQTISEMDWKSLANAGAEASKRGDRSYWREKENLDFPEDARKAMQYRDKTKSFYDAARNALNRDFGYQRGKYGDSNYTNVSMGGDFTATGEFTPHALGQKDDPMTRPHRYERGWHEYHGEKSPEEFFDDDPEAAKAYRRMEDEIKDWKDGKYTYQSGKGWIKK